MFIFKEKSGLKKQLEKAASEGKKTGFVPTLGALHEGHLSLIKKSKATDELTVCSIFVNPAQFNDPRDLANYPRPVEEDIALLTEAHCDILFLPDEKEIYPDGIDASTEHYELGKLETILEGRYRPGHFQGVARVVDRLLEIVQPDNLYIGQKDYQQCLVIKALIRQKGYATQVNILPTLREADGLAMSSRNRLLTESQRAVAGLIYQCLVSIQSKKKVQRFDVVQKECREILVKKGFLPDYIEIADAETLELLPDYAPDRQMVALIAASLNHVRLIDNLLL